MLVLRVCWTQKCQVLILLGWMKTCRWEIACLWLGEAATEQHRLAFLSDLQELFEMLRDCLLLRRRVSRQVQVWVSPLLQPPAGVESMILSDRLILSKTVLSFAQSNRRVLDVCYLSLRM